MDILADQRSFYSQKQIVSIPYKIDDLPLSVNAFRLYFHLCKYVQLNTGVFPSYEFIADDCFRKAYPNEKAAVLTEWAIAAVEELVSWNIVARETHLNAYILTDESEWFSSPVSPD